MLLANLYPKVEYISFAINLYSREDLDSVSKVLCHLYDPKTENDLTNHTLINNATLDKPTALLSDFFMDERLEEVGVCALFSITSKDG